MARMAARGRYYPSTGPSGRYSFISAVTGALSKLLSSLTASGSGTTVSADWVVSPAPSLLQGSGQTYDLTTTLPAQYTDGGVYAVDPVTQQLPSGMTITEAGTLGVGTATASTTNSVYFTYFEPGATTTLTLHSTSAGTFPYMATIYPLEGTVPSGQILLSPDDSTFRSSVLSAWPDGSAQVMVGAGRKAVSASSQTSIKLRPGLASGTNLTTTDLVAVVNTVAVNFGSALSLTLTTTNHDRIWWQNPEVICARYRLPISNKGSMEAVFDVHCFRGGRAFVEAVIENGRIDANSASPTAPATQSYTNATVAVNSTTIATVSSPTAGMSFPNQRNINGGGTYTGGHEPFRAWYCSGWVGGDPGIEVTHDTASLQAHPWFFRPAINPTFSMQTEYTKSYDSYVPWATCRLRVPGIGGTGGDPQIGLLSKDQCDYIATGNKYVRASVLATGLAQLCFQWQWRHSGSGEYVNQTPARSQYATKSSSQWPFGANTEPYYGGSQSDAEHIPISPLVPFLCRPSPVFIEMAQNSATWNYINFNGGSWFSASPGGFHYYDAPRSRAWRVRNYAVASFLTPDADVNRKTGYRDTLTAYAVGLQKFVDRSFNTLGVLWATGPGPTESTDGSVADRSSQGPQYLESFMHNFCVMVFNTIPRLKLLSGAAQAQWVSLANVFGGMPVRRMNDATAGEWRVQAIDYPIGTQVGTGNNVTINMLDGTFSACLRAYQTSGTIPAASGTWLSWNGGLNTNWNNYTYEAGFAGYEFADEFFCALVTSVENGVPDADAAWAKLYGTSANGQLTNYSAWIAKWNNAGDNSSGQWNRFPRNK